MTANSQFISVKALQALMRRGLTPSLSQRRYQRSWSQTLLDGDVTKRVFDISFSLFVLIFFSPLYLILGLLIAVSSPGPIFYIQERAGKNFKKFGCIKFRTMVHNADEVLESMMANSPQMRAEFEDNFKLRDDPRITWIGKFLRLTSLDEFPQFGNVLVGQMSLVGTRPPSADEVDQYSTGHWQRLNVKPGLTGKWQVSGRSAIADFEAVVELDLDYQKHWSFWYDILIILKTINVVFTQLGAC